MASNLVFIEKHFNDSTSLILKRLMKWLKQQRTQIISVDTDEYYELLYVHNKVVKRQPMHSDFYVQF